jgi:hypothetical protein
VGWVIVEELIELGYCQLLTKLQIHPHIVFTNYGAVQLATTQIECTRSTLICIHAYR